MKNTRQDGPLGVYELLNLLESSCHIRIICHDSTHTHYATFSFFIKGWEVVPDIFFFLSFFRMRERVFVNALPGSELLVQLLAVGRVLIADKHLMSFNTKSEQKSLSLLE